MPALDQNIFKGLYPLRVIKSAKDYKNALTSLEAVFDETRGDLAEYAETLTILLEHYESEHFPIQASSGLEVLKFLMEQNGLKQKDLIGEIGGKSTVSEILSGKRTLNLNHIKALAEKFNVSPASFI